MSTPPIKRDEIPRYAAEPLLVFTEYSKQSSRILHMCMRGISVHTMMPDTLMVLHKHTTAEAEEKRHKYEREMKRATAEADFAKKEIDAGFPLLYAHHLVGLWGALEAAVEDCLVGILINEPDLLRSDAFSRLRIPLAEFECLDKEERVRFLLAEVERGQGLGRRQGVDAFESLLGHVNLSGPVDPEIKKTMWEMHHVRNVIVHRNSLVDRRLKEACPWLGLKVGEKITVDHKSFGQYAQALGEYLMTIIYRLGAKYEVNVEGKIQEARETELEHAEDLGTD